MKTLKTFVLLTLVCFLHHNSASPVGPQSLFQNCCVNSTRMHIPKGRVKYVVMTQSDCELKALVVTTVCNKKLCIDVNWKWANNLLREFQKSTANKKPPSAPFNRIPCEKE